MTTTLQPFNAGRCVTCLVRAVCTEKEPGQAGKGGTSSCCCSSCSSICNVNPSRCSTTYIHMCMLTRTHTCKTCMQHPPDISLQLSPCCCFLDKSWLQAMQSQPAAYVLIKHQADPITTSSWPCHDLKVSSRQPHHDPRMTT